MKRLILHIGRHKTGTTRLQFFLDKHAEELRRLGACYPLTGREAPTERERTAHHQLALLLFNRDSAGLEALQPKFRAETAPFDLVVLSSEAFQNIDDTRPLRHF